MRRFVLLACLSACPAQAQPASDDPYHLTAVEKAACSADAVRLCSDAYPDAHKLLACMKENRLSLSATCLVVFDAGVKRRHL